ncbi:hypothetical protein [Mycoplasma sp. SG1]|uniref:hypothetical protein n=1 Tax=Mycoplasma sp. SG1 TaxID=2810348 RepID=UPI0020240B2B|nr:hypothetical protein [Mycoplasma sp. SG1]URM53114.1 hypothetical protein JRW51_02070 [Mycoplasma sp. SG1]
MFWTKKSKNKSNLIKKSKSSKAIFSLRKDKIEKEKKEHPFLKVLFLWVVTFSKAFLKQCKKIHRFYLIHNIKFRWSLLGLVVSGSLAGIGVLFSPVSNKFFLDPLKSHFNAYFNSSGKMYIKYINKDISNPIKQEDVKNAISKSISTLFSIYAHTFSSYSQNDLTINVGGSYNEFMAGKYVTQYLVSISGPLDLIHLLERYHNFLSGTQTITITDQWGNGIGYNPVTKTISPTDPTPFANLYIKDDKALNHHLGWPSLGQMSFSRASGSGITATGDENLGNHLQTSFAASDNDIFKTIISDIYKLSQKPISSTNPWGYFYKDKNNNWITDWGNPPSHSKPFDPNMDGHHNFLMFWLGDPWNNMYWKSDTSNPYTGPYKAWHKRDPKNNPSEFLSYDLVRQLFPSSDSPLIETTGDNTKNDFLKNNNDWKEINYLYSPLIFGNGQSNSAKYYYSSPYYDNSYMNPSANISLNGSADKSITQSDWISSQNNPSGSELAFCFLGAYDISSSLPEIKQDISELYSSLNDKGKFNHYTNPSYYAWHKWPGKDSKSDTYLDKFKNPYTTDNFDIKNVSFTNDIDKLTQYPNNINNFANFIDDSTINATTDTFKNMYNQLLEDAQQGYVNNIYALYDQDPTIMNMNNLWIIGVALLIFLLIIIAYFFVRFGLMAIPLILSFIFYNTLFLVFLILLSPNLQPFILIIYLVSLVIFLIFGLKNLEKVYGMIKGILQLPHNKLDKMAWNKYHKSYYIDSLSLLMSFIVVYLGYNFFYNFFQGVIIVWLFGWFISTILLFFFCKFIFSTIILTVHKNPEKFHHLKLKLDKNVAKINLKLKIEDEDKRLKLILSKNKKKAKSRFFQKKSKKSKNLK